MIVEALSATLPQPQTSTDQFSSSRRPRRASVRSCITTTRLHRRSEEKPSLRHFFLLGLLFWTFSAESIYGPAWECGGDWGKGISNYRQWACPCLDKNRNRLLCFVWFWNLPLNSKIKQDFLFCRWWNKAATSKRRILQKPRFSTQSRENKRS